MARNFVRGLVLRSNTNRNSLQILTFFFTSWNKMKGNVKIKSTVRVRIQYVLIIIVGGCIQCE